MENSTGKYKSTWNGHSVCVWNQIKNDNAKTYSKTRCTTNASV